ncbi:hypothetical protein [Herbaspirillum sp. B65]|uniref:hypothetical protein n=1 Tax=Herbaspirillum sp. B65 TaxID=137708 RepID=UPI0018FF7D66|nr:hypothetical protein [Herbaspirillum sp. B65]
MLIDKDVEYSAKHNWASSSGAALRLSVFEFMQRSLARPKLNSKLFNKNIYTQVQTNDAAHLHRASLHARIRQAPHQRAAKVRRPPAWKPVWPKFPAIDSVLPADEILTPWHASCMSSLLYTLTYPSLPSSCPSPNLARWLRQTGSPPGRLRSLSDDF